METIVFIKEVVLQTVRSFFQKQETDFITMIENLSKLIHNKIASLSKKSFGKKTSQVGVKFKVNVYHEKKTTLVGRTKPVSLAYL